MSKKPLRVVVTGAAGHIGYSLLFRIAGGDLFGPDQPVILNLLERDTPESAKAMKGVMMELEDCAFPLLADAVTATDPKKVFLDADAAFLVGSRPRSKDMTRADLLAANGSIFTVQGKALDQYASRNVKVLVVGNPCNTNAWIAMKSAPSLDPKCFSAMVRLDHNRALSQLATKTSSHVTDIDHMAVWGNHADTMYPDLTHCTVGGKAALSLVDEKWYKEEMIPTVAKRGTAIIVARGASSAASAASAAIDHMRDWFLGTNGNWVSMAVPSDGSYGIPEGLMFGRPVTCDGKGNYEPVRNLEFDAFGKEKIAQNIKALETEIEAVKHLL